MINLRVCDLESQVLGFLDLEFQVLGSHMNPLVTASLRRVRARSRSSIGDIHEMEGSGSNGFT